MTETQRRLLEELVRTLDDGEPRPPVRILTADEIPPEVRAWLVDELKKGREQAAPTVH